MSQAIAEPAPTERHDVAALIKAASAADHRAAESRGFITRLLGGDLGLGAYTRYLAQFGHVYEALEEPADRVFDPRLRRLPRIESDLAALDASDWRRSIPVLPATADYAAHLRTLASSPDPLDHSARFLAHHYARYLGDLSGGQAIAVLLGRHYGAMPEQLTFYDFSELGSPVHAKRDYRERLNGLDWDADAVGALTDEVRRAFRLNAAIFDQLETDTRT